MRLRGVSLCYLQLRRVGLSERVRRNRFIGVLLLVGLISSLAIAGCFSSADESLIPSPTETKKAAAIPKEPISEDPFSRTSCLSCHGPMEGLSSGHDMKVMGCSSCHLGRPQEKDKDLAHQGMILVPGNLKDARIACSCHAPTVERVLKSPMAYAQGIVAVDRFVFGEASNPDERPSSMQELGRSPADLHLRQLCASCHLGREKKSPGPIHERSRGGGCTACHLQHPKNYVSLVETQKKENDNLQKIHPTLSIQISDDHCFGCHSRSGRISTNYQGWHESRISEIPKGKEDQFRRLLDGRIFTKKPSNIHHERGLSCIDCHIASELMGDGTLYVHQEEAIKVSCEDCHLTEAPKTRLGTELDDESKRIIKRREGESALDRRFLLSRKGDHPLLNVFIGSNDKPILKGKLSDKEHPLNSPSHICTNFISGHDRLSCKSCHSAWAPQCISCHTHFNPTASAKSTYPGGEKKGRWIEYSAEFLADPPALGIRSSKETSDPSKSKIEPFIPGMILTINSSEKHIDLPSTAKTLIDKNAKFYRLYAPAVPHTTSKEGRSCESCHNDPLALGYGRGELLFSKKDGETAVDFKAEYAREKHDNLPLDAWIGFLETPKGPASTRSDARPFSIEEQKKILRVGACLKCHPGTKEEVQRIYSDFDKSLAKVDSECRIPFLE